MQKKWHKTLKIVCLVQTIGRKKGKSASPKKQKSKKHADHVFLRLYPVDFL